MSNLEPAAKRLQKIEQLLLRPTPETIRQADELLHEAAALVAGSDRTQDSVAFEDGESRPEIEDFRLQCDRLAKLLEGARRTLWIRMRLITSLTQTYTARAEAKTWPPPSGVINIRM